MIKSANIFLSFLIVALFATVSFGADNKNPKGLTPEELVIKGMENNIKENRDNIDKIKNGEIKLTDGGYYQVLDKKIENQKEWFLDKINTYRSFFIIVLSILGFFGWKNIKKQMNDRIERKVSFKVDKEFDQYLKEKLEPKIEEITSHYKNELEKILDLFQESEDLNEKLLIISQENEDINDKLQVVEKLYQDSFDLKEKLATVSTISKDKITNELKEDLKTYIGELSEVKTEEKYSANDWYYKGLTEEDRKTQIKYYTRAVELKPDFHQAYHNRGSSFFDMKQFDKAVLEYSKAITINPKYDIAYHNRGSSYHGLKDYQHAAEDYTKAIELKPDYQTAYINRGSSYHNLEKYEQAISDYTKAIELKPEQHSTYYKRGNSYRFFKNYDLAIKDYSKAIELKPDYYNAYFDRGRCYTHKRDFMHATTDYIEAIKIKNDAIIAIENLTEIYIISNNNEKAYEQISNLRKHAKEIKDKITSRYLECLSLKLNNKQTNECEKEFNELIETKTEVSWDSQELEDWLKEVDLDKDKKVFIEKITKQFKVYIEKNKK